MNDLDQIKEILFGNEKKAIDAIVRRLETPESRTADVADVLPDAVTRSYNRDGRLGRALSQPVEHSLSAAIRREPKKFADALFPVMGPAIRKAIAEALKSMLQSMNNAIDTSLSPTARFKAWRAGVPLAEWVFRQSLVYRVDEIYLVDPESGLLVSYLHHADVEKKDEDAVSAMLTAIQDFVRDSFAKGTGGGLESAVIGELTVLISQGPHAMLACVIRGVPPAELKSQISATNERVHLRHSQNLLEFDGHTGSIPGLDGHLEELLRIERIEKDDQQKKSLLSLPLLAVLFGIIGLTLFFMLRGYFLDNKIAEYQKQLRQAPGVFATSLQRDGGKVLVKGLRDPLAIDPIALAEQVGIRLTHLEHEFLSFQSLDPQVVELRAKQILKPPQSIAMHVEDDVLILEGTATAKWLDYVNTVAPTMGGIRSIDSTGLRRDDASILAQVKSMLQPPEEVNIVVTQGVVFVSGSAPVEWHDQLNNIRTEIPGVVDVNSENLHYSEELRMTAIRQQLQNRAIVFRTGSTLIAGQEQELEKSANLIREYSTLVKDDREPLQITLMGFVDGSGDASLNVELMNQRASVYRDQLIARGVNPQWLSIDTAVVPKDTSQALEMRKAELVLNNNSK